MKESVRRWISVAAFVLFTGQAHAGFWIINGDPVEPSQYKEVVQLVSSDCTATVIGPRTIVTAAHCVDNGETASFTIGGEQYQAKMTRSSQYPAQDHDIALGFTTKEMTGVKPATVGGKATSGLELILMGYGCNKAGGDKDRTLRQGRTVITSLANLQMVSRKANGAAVCFGDSGGPAFIEDGGKRRLLGVHSTGNVQDTNFDVRTDVDATTTFMKSFADTNSTTICGINANCDGGPGPTPDHKAPTCRMAATPSSVRLGETVTVSIVTQGEVTDASIDGETVTFPTGSREIATASTGTFTARGRVTGPGGTATCDATYVVTGKTPTPTAPSCTLTAFPEEVKVGESVTLELTSQGNVTSASIDGTSVAIPLGRKIVTPSAKGSFTSLATVSGPGGSNSCSATYSAVDNGPGPGPGPTPSTTPTLAVVPAFCGQNTVSGTPISTVCLAVIKRDDSVPNLKITQAVLVNYTDGTREVMPIINRTVVPNAPGDSTGKEDVTLYANGSVSAKDFQVLDVRKATMTKTGNTPTALEGRSGKGNYFSVSFRFDVTVR